MWCVGAVRRSRDFGVTLCAIFGATLHTGHDSTTSNRLRHISPTNVNCFASARRCKLCGRVRNVVLLMVGMDCESLDWCWRYDMNIFCQIERTPFRSTARVRRMDNWENGDILPINRKGEEIESKTSVAAYSVPNMFLDPSLFAATCLRETQCCAHAGLLPSLFRFSERHRRCGCNSDVQT
jgi:hypothetical protein